MASERTGRARKEASVVVLVFAVVGAACGWLWHWIWAPAADGFVYQQIPRFDDDVVIRSTGLYFVVAVIAGLALGLVLTWCFEADELLTLAAVVVGSLVAGWLMLWVGTWLGPESMDDVAARSQDWDEVKASLVVSGVTPWVAFPGGALSGAFVIWACFRSRAEAARRISAGGGSAQ